MSHTTKLEGLAIKSVSAIRKAVQVLKSKNIMVELVEKAVPRMYYDSQEQEVGECDFVIKLKDSNYDVGLKLNTETKEYELIFDEWDDQIRNVIGVPNEVDFDTDEQRLANVAQFNLHYTKSLIEDQLKQKSIYNTSFVENETNYCMVGVA